MATPDGSYRLCRRFAVVVLVLLAVKEGCGQAGMLWSVCKNQKDGSTFPATNCNQYLQCSQNTATLKTCGTGNYNPNSKQCESGYTDCRARGLWRQTMDHGGLVAVHCTLMPGSPGFVSIWHRALANLSEIPPDMQQPGGFGHEYMSAVIDPLNKQRKGYEVAPVFCGGHVILPDGGVMNCGGEPQGFNGRGSADKDTNQNKCRILRCPADGAGQYSVNNCNWQLWTTINKIRWYPGALVFPAYNQQQGVFVMITGGSTLGYDPSRVEHVEQSVDWVWPYNAGMKTKNTRSTTFTQTVKEMNMYPMLWVMPFRRSGTFVAFQWAVNYGELILVKDPATTDTPISTLRVLPKLPNGLGVTYPTGGCGVLHPLEYPWNNSATVTVFGGHRGTFNSFNDLAKIDGSWQASDKSYTIDLTNPNSAWQERQMPGAATMRTCIALPNGKVLLFHGVKNGRMTSTPYGLGCGKYQVYNAWIYDPKTGAYKVDPVNEPTFRAYHSCGLVMPDGSLFGAGGDTGPLPDGETQCKAPRKLYFQTDAYITPANLQAAITSTGPYIKAAPAVFNYGKQHSIQYSGPVDECSLVVPGSNTHEVEYSSRVVFLRTISNDKTAKVLVVEMPMDAAVILPGTHMLFCVAGRETYSQGKWVKVQYA